MKCPYCGKEMYNGFIRAQTPIVPFIFSGKNKPDDELMKFNFLVSSSSFIPLSKTSFGFIAPKAISYYCDNCKIAITPAYNRYK